MKSSEKIKAEKYRKSKSSKAFLEMPAADVVKFFIEESKHECVREDSPLDDFTKKKENE